MDFPLWVAWSDIRQTAPVFPQPQRAEKNNLKGVKLDRLTLFGLFAVSAMMLCYTFERRSPWFILGFAASCALGSIYGFLQGAWPFGLVEGVWSVIAFSRWLKTKKETHEP